MQEVAGKKGQEEQLRKDPGYCARKTVEIYSESKSDLQHLRKMILVGRG